VHLRHVVTRPIRFALRAAGYDVIRIGDLDALLSLPPDFREQDREDVQFVAPYTMVPPERIFTLARAVEYILANRIEGDFVECGTWKGGCAMTMARALMCAGSRERTLYLYDLFGRAWPEPTDKDRHRGMSATEQAARLTPEERAQMDYGLEEVRANLARTGYPAEKLHFVPGDIRQTLPADAPEHIALLRLDTDYYESTLHELVHLYPRLVSGGVLIIDDYGDWEGSRKATDEYIEREGLRIHLIRVDQGARMAVKP
jgi:hypothetical protein